MSDSLIISSLRAAKRVFLEGVQQVKSTFTRAFSGVRGSPTDRLASPSLAFPQTSLNLAYGARGVDDTTSAATIRTDSAASFLASIMTNSLQDAGRGANTVNRPQSTTQRDDSNAVKPVESEAILAFQKTSLSSVYDARGVDDTTSAATATIRPRSVATARIRSRPAAPICIDFKTTLLNTGRGAHGAKDTQQVPQLAQQWVYQDSDGLDTTQNNLAILSFNSKSGEENLRAEGRDSHRFEDTNSTSQNARSAPPDFASFLTDVLQNAARSADAVNRPQSAAQQVGSKPATPPQSEFISSTRKAYAGINTLVDRIQDKVSLEVLNNLKSYAKTSQENVPGENNLNNRLKAVERYVEYVLKGDPTAMLDLSNLKLNSVFKVADDVRMINLSGNPLTPRSSGLFDNLPADLDHLDLRGTKMNEFPSSFAAKTDCYIMISKGVDLSVKGKMQIADRLNKSGPDYRYLPFSTP